MSQVVEKSYIFFSCAYGLYVIIINIKVIKENMTKIVMTGNKTVSCKTSRSAVARHFASQYIYIYIIEHLKSEITPPSGKTKNILNTFLYGYSLWWRNRSFLRNKAICSFASMSLFAFLLGASSIFSNSVSASSYTFNLTTSGAQNIDVSTTGTGIAIGVDNITVATTCHAGYNLTLSSSVDDNNLYLNGDASNNTAGTFFAPADGTTDLATADNTWGYYLPASGGSAPTSSSVFNAVPVTGSPATLRTASQTAGATDISDSFSVYYGVSASSDMTAGAYKMKKDGSNVDGSLVYYATLSENCFKYTVHFDPTGTNMGTAITGTGTVADQMIDEGIATNLTSSKFGNPTVSGTTYYFTGWNTAQDGSGTQYTSGQSVTDLTAAGSTITLYAQWTDCPGGKFCYKANGSNVVGTMGQQTVSNSATSTMLLASNYSRTGYGFAGWSEDPDAASHLSTATVYGPQETVELTAGTYQNAGRNLYAVWVASAGNLQNWTCPNDTTMPIGTVTALTDQRDGDTYAVAKLADGKCWMIENMRLGNTNSDNATGVLAQGYGGQFAGLANPESVALFGTTTANTLYSTNGSNNTINLGTSYADYRFPRYNNINTPSDASDRPQEPTTNTAANSVSGARLYSYGNYYTWAAAIADTTSYSTSNQSITTTAICPSGWRLPKGGDKTNESNNEFWLLFVTRLNNGTNPANYDNQTQPYYVSTENASLLDALRSYPNNFVYSGLTIYGGKFFNVGTYGSYWTSTTQNVGGAYGAEFWGGTIYPGTYDYGKFYGRTIRCVAPSP